MTLLLFPDEVIAAVALKLSGASRTEDWALTSGQWAIVPVIHPDGRKEDVRICPNRDQVELLAMGLTL